MAKLKNVIKQTDNKYLNLYQAEFEHEKGTFFYFIASRKKRIEDLAVVTQKINPDAVRILPYYYDEHNQLTVVIIKEFRYPINDFIYSVPAGLIDEGESPEQACVRELHEEIGAMVKSFTLAEKASYSLAGLTDESLVTFEAEIENFGKENQKLDSHENIEILSIKLTELKEFLDKNNIGLLSLFQLRAFYYKNIKVL